MNDVEQVFDWASQREFQDMPHEYGQTLEKGEKRRHWLLGAVEHLVDAGAQARRHY